MTSVEAEKEWKAHLKTCEQCQRYVHGDLRTTDDGTGWARSWEACDSGRALWQAVVNLKDREAKNRS